MEGGTPAKAPPHGHAPEWTPPPPPGGRAVAAGPRPSPRFLAPLLLMLASLPVALAGYVVYVHPGADVDRDICLEIHGANETADCPAPEPRDAEALGGGILMTFSLVLLLSGIVLGVRRALRKRPAS